MNNLLDNFYDFLNKNFGKILTSLKIETPYKMEGKEKRCTEIQFTDDEICKNTGKWSKFLSEALEKTIGQFLQNLEEENKESFELISSKTKKEFLVDIIIVEKKDIIKPAIEYTDEKGEGRQHKKPVEIYKKIKVAIEYEWDIGKDGCHFFTRDFPKLAHIKADYYIVIYLNPEKYKRTRQNLANIIKELGFGSNNFLVVELSRDDSSKTFTIDRIKVDRKKLDIKEGNSIQCNQSK